MRARVAPVGERGPVRADAQRLTQALINLITNTREHAPPGTRSSAEWVSDGRAGRFEVADTGGSIPEGRVFQPFDKGRASRGSGLGLSIVAGIARAHGGTAGIENRRGQGATFWLQIPE